MRPALGSVTEARLTQIAAHTFRGYVPALGSAERAGCGDRPPRGTSVAESSEGTSRSPARDPISPADEPGGRARAKLVRREGIEPRSY